MAILAHNDEIAASIEKIVANRRRQVPGIEASIRCADMLREVLKGIESQRDLLSGLLSPEKCELLATAGRDCQSAMRQLSSLRERFNRSFLTLLCFGRARQGKSRMLQSLTGLGDREIPTGRLGHCTGATIEVLHEPGSPHAEISTYTEAEFLRERVIAFYRDFGLEEQAPNSLDDFLVQRLPDPKDAAAFIGMKNAESQLLCGRYAELFRIQQRLPVFRKHLTGRTEQVSIPKLKQWVSHPDAATGTADAGADYRCFAVHKARVFVTMPMEEFRSIRIFDTAGLDSHNSGDYDALASLLDNEADAALITRLPSHLGDDWMAADSRILDEVNNQLVNGVALNDIATVVLNEVRHEGEPNRLQCETVRRGAIGFGVAPAGITIADCSDRESLRREVIVPMLERLVETCPQQDAKRLARPLATLQDVARQTRSLLEELAEAARTAAARIDPDEHFLKWLDEGQQKLTSGLRLLKVNASQHRHDIDEEFLEDVHRVEEQASEEIAVPSAQEIHDYILRSRRAEIGSALDHFLQKLRCELAAMFGQLRNDLGRSVIERWRSANLQVVEQTGITRLVERGNSETVFRQLADLADRSGGVPHLTTSFRMLADFRIHFPHFLATIWKVLEEFEPNEHIADLGKPGGDNAQTDKVDLAAVPIPMCQRAAKKLADLKRRAIQAISKELTKVASLPSELSWALICDVHDRIIIAEGVDTEWKLFLRPHRRQLMSGRHHVQAAERERLLQAESLAHELNGRLVSVSFTAADAARMAS